MKCYDPGSPGRPGSSASLATSGAAQQAQQTGMLFINTQQVQPDFIMAAMDSQQDWIMAQQAGSPLVHVMQTPSSVASQWQRPMVRL